MQTPKPHVGKAQKKLIFIVVFALLISVLSELLIANYRMLFLYDKEDFPTVDLADYCDSNIAEDGSYVVRTSASGSASLSFSEVPGGFYSIAITLSYANKEVEDYIPVPTVTVTATDPRTSWNAGGFITVAKDMICVGQYGEPVQNTVYASIENHGKGRLRLAFADLADEVKIEQILLNPTPTLTFSALRTLLIFLVLTALSLFFVYRRHPMLYDPDSPRHRAVMILPVVLTLLITGMLSPLLGFTEKIEIAYPLTSNVERYQPYIQQFDAWMKGQLHLDVTVSDELLNVENPYDYASRVEYSPLWDRAYYDGHYYSYFGISPILVLYLPYYLLNRALPSDALVMLFFLTLTAIFIPLTVKKWADLHEKRRLPFPLLFLGAVTAFVGSLAPLIARGVNPFYYIATLSGNAFLSVFLYLLLCAEGANRPMHKRILYALAGLAYGLLFHARINIAVLAAFVVLPYLFFRILLRRDAPEEDPSDSRFRRICRRFAPWKESVPSLLALGLPVAAAIGAAMVLNLLRFDNPFEFGASYQFTVSDIRYNHLSFADLFPAIYHYFFQPLNLSSGIFPYLSLQKIVLNNYGHYVYVDVGLGLFSIPLFCILLLSPAALRLKARSRYEKTLLVSCLVGLVLVAWMNFSLGGVIFRYTCDLTQIAALASVFLAFAFAGRPETAAAAANNGEIQPTETRQTAPYIAAIIFLVISLVVLLLLSISENLNLADYPSSLLYAIKRFFTFG